MHSRRALTYVASSSAALVALRLTDFTAVSISDSAEAVSFLTGELSDRLLL